MDHAVHYRTRDGETKFDEVASLDAAVAMVERLRNDEGVSDVRLYKHVPIEFKAYYKVVVGDEAVGEPTPAAPEAAPEAPAAPPSPPPGAMPLGSSTPSSASTPSTQPVASASEPEPEPEQEPDAGRRGSLFSRG